MAASLGDLIQIVDKQTYLGEECLNVYYYRITSITGLDEPYPEVLADWYIDNVMSAVLDVQVAQLTHNSVEVRNISNNLDFAEVETNVPGTIVVAGDAIQPSFVTLGFQLIRETLATRNGYKRYSGIAEAWTAGNVFNHTTTEVNALAAVLSEDIVLGVVTVAEPVIARRPLVPPVGTGYTYSSIGDALFKGLGTQNTRKP